MQLYRPGSLVVLTLKIVLISFSVFLGLRSESLSAESSPAKARLSSSIGADPFPSSVINLQPLALQGGSELTLIAPQGLKTVSEKLKLFLIRTHTYYSKLFGELPVFKTSVRLMEQHDFYLQTGAPSWTNALYVRNQILIPIEPDKVLDDENLYRSVRHEYLHAVTNALSNGKCPGWLDEGLAQWAEGDENPALQPALIRWLKKDRPVPLALLQGGFTKLEPQMVPAAYAQSLFAANAVINSFGFENIRIYLDSLKAGQSDAEAFVHGFQLSPTLFEKKLGFQLMSWVQSKEDFHPFHEQLN